MKTIALPEPVEKTLSPRWAIALVLAVACYSASPSLASDVAASPSPADRGGASTSGTSSFGEPLPGTEPFPESLVSALEKAWAARPASYVPHTRHVRPDGSPKYTNRLFLERSPYLLQHAHNPVNWFPWGDEAFDRARALGRPVFLSVGYSTCHWCHVMEEESFEDPEIATYLNEHYVAIKVDREERPDVDAIYMSAVQMLTGSGGWPMNVWLTHDRKPFFGGTYFPARDGDRGAGTGFLTLLSRLSDAYHREPDQVVASAVAITSQIRESLGAAPAGGGLPTASVLHSAAKFFASRFDDTWGGLAGAPKFPSSPPARFLLRYHRRTGDARSLAMVTRTLEKMASGGIHDQVGGGFHRYSTDSQWLVPHFEKMLYDNALLAVAYLETYQATGREDFAAVARDILHYVERDMTSPAGAFYSASDADSPGPSGHREEGWFYTWTPDEVRSVLDENAARAVLATYAVTQKGNFGERTILSTPRPIADVAKSLGLTPDSLHATLEQARGELYGARERRPHPFRDEKVLTAWNGLMISAFARAALTLGDADYAERASRAAEFVLANLVKDGRLLRSYEDGVAHVDGDLDDYAFFIAGLLDVFEATSETRWLRAAVTLDRVLEQHYEDAVNGGFFMTSEDHEVLLAREKPSSDDAEPSGNSVEALNLLRLADLTTQDTYRRRAEKTLRAFQPRLGQAPAGLSEMLLAVDSQLDTPKEVVLVAPRSRDDAAPLLAELRRVFLPNRVVVVVVEGGQLDDVAAVVPLVKDKTAQGGRATAYVCERQVCELPTTDPAAFARQLGAVKPLASPGPAP